MGHRHGKSVVTRRVVRQPELWRTVDLRIRRAVSLDAAMGTAYEHPPLCECAVCVAVQERLARVIERIEAEVRQELVCEVADDLETDVS